MIDHSILFLLGLVFITSADTLMAFLVLRRIRRIEAIVATHRGVLGTNVEAIAALKGRFTQVEMQLGRTMRAVGVRGTDP